VLTDLPRLAREDSTFAEELMMHRFVPTCAGAYARPQELFDPMVPDMRLLLDGSCFPAAFLADRPDCMASLRTLGLRTTMTRDAVRGSISGLIVLLADSSMDELISIDVFGCDLCFPHSASAFRQILVSARTIAQSLGSDDVTLGHAKQRSHHLLRMLDTQIERFIAADPAPAVPSDGSSALGHMHQHPMIAGVTSLFSCAFLAFLCPYCHQAPPLLRNRRFVATLQQVAMQRTGCP
jgi:hypothetical protein